MPRIIPSLLFVPAVLAASAIAYGAAVPAETPAEKGRRAMTGKSFNPPTMTKANYDNAWKNWGLTEKPADYDRLFRERYGLHPAPYANDGLPMGLRLADNPIAFTGKGLTTDCLTCHGGSIFGTSYVGLGNTALDFQAFYEEVTGPVGRKHKPPFVFSNVRGTSEAGAMSVFLLGHREDDLSIRLTRRDLDLQDDLCEDVPAWWIFRKKKTIYHTGGADQRSSRALMQFMMSPLNFPGAFHKAEADFKNIREFLASIEPPKYPLHVDAKKAETGKGVFTEHCAKCHGTYGEKWTYPNKVVALKDIGTDPRRFEGITKKFGEAYNKSWFAEDYKAIETDGYQAPPLDGIWATAPYLHNGSVPTLEHLLDSKSRPKVFTRSFATGKEDYDDKRVGWKVKVLDKVPAGLSGLEARKVYDTTKVGRSNAGHTYGDRLTAEERAALVEYLKTL